MATFSIAAAPSTPEKLCKSLHDVYTYLISQACGKWDPDVSLEYQPTVLPVVEQDITETILDNNVSLLHDCMELYPKWLGQSHAPQRWIKLAPIRGPRRTKGLPPELVARTLAHEFGHVYLNHVNLNRIRVAQHELEAEAFSLLWCLIHGHNYWRHSVAYIGWKRHYRTHSGLRAAAQMSEAKVIRAVLETSKKSADQINQEVKLWGQV